MTYFLFQGRFQISGRIDSIEVEAVNKEAAIAYIEAAYPTFKWWVVKQLPNSTR